MRSIKMKAASKQFKLVFGVAICVILSVNFHSFGESHEFLNASQSDVGDSTSRPGNFADSQPAGSFPIFGDFSWNDALPDVLHHLSTLPGIDEVTLNIQAGYAPKIIDITGEHDVKSVLEKLGQIKGSMDVRSKFINAAGNQSEYRERDIAIMAAPIMINDVAFSLKLTLRACPMIAVLFPSKAPIQIDSGIELPYLLTDVQLGEIKSNTCDDKVSEIIELMKNKYPTLDWSGADGQTAIARSSDGSSVISVNCNQRIMISYSSMSQLQFYKKLYNERLREADADQSQGRPDSSGKL